MKQTTLKRLSYKIFGEIKVGNFIGKMSLHKFKTLAQVSCYMAFDNPGQLENAPKFFELKRKDELGTVATGRIFIVMNESTRLSTKTDR